jgi:hypothetical protein
LKTASLSRINLLKIPLFFRLIVAFSSGIVLFFAASDLYSQVPLDREIAEAVKKVVPCKWIEVKTKPEGSRGEKLKSVMIKFEGVSKNFLPADYVTVQYANPVIDLRALRNSGVFSVISQSDFKIGVLVSDQALKNEFDKRAKKSNIRYNKFLIKFTPPHIELEFDIPAGAIPSEHRQFLEKFAKNKKFEGYAALRLEVRDNKVFAFPTKVILNHFLLPTPVLDELAKRINPLYPIPLIQPFTYSLQKVGIQKRYIFFSN